MFGPGKKQIEIDRLLEVERTLTQRVADLEEEKRILESAVSGLRDELLKTQEALTEAESKAGRLLLDLEREKAVAEDLRVRLEEREAEMDGYEKEAERINRRLDSIAGERAGYKARIANLSETVSELRSRLGEGTNESRTLDFSDLDEEMRTAATDHSKRRPYGEPFRPQTPPTQADRDWLSDLPPF